MRKRLVRWGGIGAVILAALVFQDTLEFYAMRAWIALTQPSTSQPHPIGKNVADVVLRHYYDRLEAVAFYRLFEACADQACLNDVLFDLDPHANLYLPEDSTEASCPLQPSDVAPISEHLLYLHIRSFEMDQGCLEQLWQRLSPHRAIPDLVLDLRGNGGGYFEDALAVGSLFIPSGTRLYTPLERYPKDYLWGYFNLPLEVSQAGVKNRLGQHYPFAANQSYKLTPQRIYILIDRDSASASEILANLLNRYAQMEVLIAGDDFSLGVGNTLMSTYSAGEYRLDLPTAVLPGFGVYAQPEISLQQAIEQLHLPSLP